MAPRPIAKGYCEYCGTFFIWDRKLIYVLMHERPNPPEVISNCPQCKIEIRNLLNFKEAYIFSCRGVEVRHTYDTENDVQPLTEDDVKLLEKNLDKFLETISEG